MLRRLSLFLHAQIEENTMKTIYTTIFILLVLPINVLAKEDVAHWELGVNSSKVGNIGKSNGVELSYRIQPRLRLRLNHQAKLDYQTQKTFADISFTEGLEQKNASVALDWFPFERVAGAYTSIGVVQLGDTAKLRAIPDASKNFTFNGTTYTGLSPINGQVKTDKQVPMVGFGYQYAPKPHGWFAQAGVSQIFNLNPKLELIPEVNIAGTLANNLQAEANKKNGELKDSYTLYGITLGYRF